MKHLCIAIAIAVLLGFSTNAAAHAEAPLARKAHVVDQGEWVLRTNFGIISSQAPDRFVCEEAFLGGDRFFVAPLGTTTWVTFGETSIHRTEDGCEFEKVDDITSRIEDVDQDPASDGVVYVANGEGAGVFYSTDAGKTFEAVGTLDAERFQITSVRFLDATTLVVGTYDRDGEGAANVVTIDVTTGTTEPLQLDTQVTYPYVIAAGAERVVINARAEVQTLFVGTPDQPTMHARPSQPGETWPTGAAIAEDGSRIFIAGLFLGNGLTSAEWNDTELDWQSSLEPTQVGCVEESAGALLVCSSSTAGARQGDLLALDEAMQMMPLVIFERIEGPSQCPAGTDVATVCPLVWPEVGPALGVDVEQPANDDGGTDDETDDEATGGGQTDDDGCATTRADATFPALLLIALFLAARRTSRRRELV